MITEADTGIHRLSDGGLQVERTALAWRRSVLSSTVAGVVLLKVSFETAGWTLSLFATACVLLGVALPWMGVRRHEGALREMGPRGRSTGRATFQLAAGMASLAILVLFAIGESMATR